MPDARQGYQRDFGKDNEVKISEVLHGDPKKIYNPKAYHDPDTGMYTLPEPKVNPDGSEFVQHDDTKLWLPKPTEFKVTRILAFDFGPSLEVEESFSEVQAAIDVAMENLDGCPDWFAFHDPVFGAETRVSRAHLARVYAVFDSYRDMEQTKFEFDVKAYQQRQQRMQMHSQLNGGRKLR